MCQDSTPDSKCRVLIPDSRSQGWLIRHLDRSHPDLSSLGSSFQASRSDSRPDSHYPDYSDYLDWSRPDSNCPLSRSAARWCYLWAAVPCSPSAGFPYCPWAADPCCPSAADPVFQLAARMELLDPAPIPRDRLHLLRPILLRPLNHLPAPRPTCHRTGLPLTT